MSIGPIELSHLPLDKMAAISQTAFWNEFSGKKPFGILIKISLKFDSKDQIENKAAMVQIKARHRTGQQVIIWAIGGLVHWAYMRHLASNS